MPDPLKDDSLLFKSSISAVVLAKLKSLGAFKYKPPPADDGVKRVIAKLFTDDDKHQYEG